MRQDLHLRLEASKRTAETNMAAVARSLEAVLDSRQRWSRGRTQRELLHDSVVARLEARLASQPVIEQAKGVIMCRSGCRADEALTSCAARRSAATYRSASWRSRSSRASAARTHQGRRQPADPGPAVQAPTSTRQQPLSPLTAPEGVGGAGRTEDPEEPAGPAWRRRRSVVWAVDRDNRRQLPEQRYGASRPSGMYRRVQSSGWGVAAADIGSDVPPAGRRHEGCHAGAARRGAVLAGVARVRSGAWECSAHPTPTGHDLAPGRVTD